MTHVETAPHECEGNLIFTEHGLSPYWIIGKVLTTGFDGYSGDIETEIDADDLEPMVTWGTNPGQAVGISDPVPAPEDLPEGG